MRRLPNAISVLRAACAVPVILLVTPATASAALALFIAAALTDALDGALARAVGAESATGALLDPLADKVLVLGTLAGLVGLGAADPLPVALILAREAFVTAVRTVAAGKGLIVPASSFGKAKAVLQGAAVAALLTVVAWPQLDATGIAHAVLWLAVAATVLTAVDVLRRAAIAIPAPAR